MKRIAVWLITAAFIFCGCELKNNSGTASVPQITDKEEIVTEDETEKMKAVWFSYIDLSSVGLSEEEFKVKMETAFKNVKSIGINAVICQVRANSDAAYNSELFPMSKEYSGKEGVSPGYDPLSIMTECARSENLKIHAWINPYRVNLSGKISELSADNPALKYIVNNKADGYNLIVCNKGIYYNPQSEEVKKLVLSGIKEILDNYDVDGIHIDDYFYPTDSGSFDKKSYKKYKKSTKTPLSLGDWRRTNVSDLVSRIYRLVHRYKDKVFGVSPAASISDNGSDSNYKTLFADVYSWINDFGYVDYIAPQLYFGYKYPEDEFKFDNVLKKWVNIKRNKKIRLYIGLAPYKINTEDSGTKEWITDKGIVAKETAQVLSSSADGVIYYSYSFMFGNTQRIKEETKLIENKLKNYL